MPNAAVSSSTSATPAASPWTHLSFVEVLEDLSSRFIVNLPSEELQRIERICFQVEQAHWFYEDFLRPLNSSLPSLNLRKFSIYILQTASLSVPLIRQYVSSGSDKDEQGTVSDLKTLGGATYGLEAAFDEFMKYKTRVPVCGAVLLSEDWKSCLLVKGWKSSAAWGFPKGKINQSESHRDCAVRETYEETGFDCSQMVDPESLDWMELSVREQTMRLYIVPGISKATVFETQTRKEISKIEWFKLSDLPTWKQSQAAGNGGLASASTTGSAKFYLVTPFIGKLKHWIRENKQRIQQQQKRDQRPFEQSRDAVVPPSEPAAMRQSVPEVLNPETVIAKGREEAHRSERKHDSNGAQTRANQQSDSAALLSMLTGSLDLTPKASESQPLESQPVKDSRSSPEEPTDIPGISQPDEERDQKRKALLAHLLRGEPSHQPAKASQYPSPAFSRESESTEREGALLALLRGQDSHYPSNHANEMRSHPPHAQSPLPAHLLPPNYTAHCGQSMREQPQPASPDVGRASLLEMLNAGPMHSPRAPSTLGQIPFPAQSQTGHGYLNGLAPSHPHSGGGHFSPAMSLPPPPFARSPHFAPSINGWGYPSTAWQHPPASASPSPRPAVPPTHHAMPPSAHPGYAQNNFALPPGPRPVYQESPHPAYREHSQAPQNPLLSLLNGQSASTTSEAR